MRFFNLEKQYNSIKNETDKAILKVLKSAVFIGGKEVERFEKEFAKFCGIKYAISVNSGTDALFLSLKSLGIGSGDEVITTPFTFIATAEAIINCGAKPVFVDINPETFNINLSKIEKAITKKTKAIIPIHLFGQMADMTEMIKIAKKHNLFVIEDAAQAVGAEYKGRKSGTIGNLGCFSFFPSKNLGAFGDGGMVITNNKKLADKIRLLKNHGSSPKEKYLNLIVGTNSRLDAIQAAILRIKLKHLSRWNRKRVEIAKYYNRNLNKIKDVRIPFTASNRNHIFHQYTIRLRSKQARDKLKKHLEKIGIPTGVYYPLPLHLQPAFKFLGYKKGDFPESKKAAHEVLSLPIYPEIEKEQQEIITKKIKEFYAEK